MGTLKKDKKNAMVNLIEKGEDGIDETHDVLARVWRITLYRYGLSLHQWHRLITKYQERVNRLSSEKGSANMKGIMTRRLAEDKISWGTLMRGFAILEFDKIEITFRLTKRNDVRDIKMVITNDELDIVEDND